MLLSIDSVTVRHWRGQHSTLVLDEVSLALDVGEFGGVFAQRNAGKTTLARVVAGLTAPDSGRIVLDGHDVTPTRHPHRRGVLFPYVGLASREGPKVADMTVGDWLASSLVRSLSWREARREAIVILDRFGASGLARASWNEISNSERTAVSLAQAMTRQPRLLVVDDLIAGLGELSKLEVGATLHGIADSGVALLMMSADIGHLGGVDRIWSLTSGQLLGPPPRAGADVIELRPSERGRSA